MRSSQIDLLRADIAKLREEKVARMRSLEIALHEELRGLELVHQARGAQQAARDAAAVIDAQLDEQLEVLAALIPEQRKA